MTIGYSIHIFFINFAVGFKHKFDSIRIIKTMKLRRLAAVALAGYATLPSMVYAQNMSKDIAGGSQMSIHSDQGKPWSLKDCLDYAMENNIQVKKTKVSAEQGEVNLQQQKAQLLPSLSFSTNHSMGYRPFQQSTAIVQNGQVTSTSNKTTYQGSYSVSANWTVWNGGINRMNIEAQELKNDIANLSIEQTELSLKEQITQLYISALYATDAWKVANQLCETAKKQYERAQQMQLQGQMSKADVAQLEAQYQSAEYDKVNCMTTIQNTRRQLKSLLQLDMNSDFWVQDELPSDEAVTGLIPDKNTVYEKALASRPEIKTAEMNVESAQLQERIAKAGYLPTISMNAGVSDSHYTGSNQGTGEQMKRNLNSSLGLSVSVPIFDQRRNKSAVENAKLQHTTSQLDLADQKNTLSSTIQDYWLNANNNQQRYLAAKSTLKSQQESYNLLNEQFNEGLKNTVDLLQGRDALLNAQQNLLQSKYNTLLYIQLLKFYSGEEIKL